MSLMGMCFAYCRGRVREQIKNETGASLVEYALLLALIAIVCIAAVTFIGERTKSNLTSTASQLS